MQYEIEGGRRLQGDILVQGSKNSALPILAASILNSGQTVIHNCPDLSDVDAAIGIIKTLGCDVIKDGNTVIVDADVVCKKEIPETLMREMRSSIIFLGAILARCQKARLSFPGGCELGARPIDLHIAGLRKMGVTITEKHGFLDCHAKNGLKGTKITFSFPSVGATENIMIAATIAEGTTEITNPAREPEIEDLAMFLNSCGAKISFSDGKIIIQGVKKLNNCEYTVMPDRIAAATYLCAGAITMGDVTVRKINPDYIHAILPVFEAAGCQVMTYSDSVRVISDKRLNSAKIVRTMPYPGFPTDIQAPIMSIMSVADGTTVFVENIFENRFKHAGELARLGADIRIEGRVAIVEGVPQLLGGTVESTDLRGGAAMVIAALAADGYSIVRSIKHIDRGYEQFEQSLSALGAKIIRNCY